MQSARAHVRPQDTLLYDEMWSPSKNILHFSSHARHRERSHSWWGMTGSNTLRTPISGVTHVSCWFSSIIGNSSSCDGLGERSPHMSSMSHTCGRRDSVLVCLYALLMGVRTALPPLIVRGCHHVSSH